LTSVPAICVDYLIDENIIVETWPNSNLHSISKNDVLEMCLSSSLYPAKTSRHIFSYDVPPIFIPLEDLK